MTLQKVNYEAQSDSYWVQLSPDELKLISSFFYNFRLGVGNRFKEAASELLQAIELGTSHTFVQEAAAEVGLYTTLEDPDGKVGCTIDSTYMCFEVHGGDDAQSAIAQLALAP